MIIFGALLVWLGFMLVIPRGASSGSASHRNVPMGMQGIFQTPGYHREEESSTSFSSRSRIVTGLALMAVGIVMVAFGS